MILVGFSKEMFFFVCFFAQKPLAGGGGDGSGGGDGDVERGAGMVKKKKIP